LVVAVAGLIVFAVGGFSVYWFAPNAVRPILEGISGLKGVAGTNGGAADGGTNRGAAAGIAISTNKGGTNVGSVAASPPEPDPWKGLKVGDIRLDQRKDSTLVYALGTVRNSSDKQRYGVKVVLDLFDKDHKKVGTATDYTQFIDADKEWHFKALVTAHNVATAEPASVTEQ
jgi:hypothetical protein